MKYAVFIISHERANRVETYSTLRSSGYAGIIHVFIDNEDTQKEAYLNRFGTELVIFNKQIHMMQTDTLELDKRKASAVYARNAVELYAKARGYDVFIIMDDDITNLRYRWMEGNICKSMKVSRLDLIFKWYCEYLCSCDIATLSFEHCMFYLGGITDEKVMNERWTYQIHIRNTRYPVDWIAVFNEDIITEISTATRGYIWWSLPHIVFDNVAMNCESGGVKELYESISEYKRAFMATVANPSSCKPGYSHGKLRIQQNKKASYPMIISGRWKK